MSFELYLLKASKLYLLRSSKCRDLNVPWNNQHDCTNGT
jgi:hypothetical protein